MIPAIVRRSVLPLRLEEPIVGAKPEGAVTVKGVVVKHPVPKILVCPTTRR